MGETARHQDNEEPIARIGLRLAAWYAVVFVGTSLAIVLLTYRLLAASLEGARSAARDLHLASIHSAMRKVVFVRLPTQSKSSSGRAGRNACSCASCGGRPRRSS